VTNSPSWDRTHCYAACLRPTDSPEEPLFLSLLVACGEADPQSTLDGEATGDATDAESNERSDENASEPDDGCIHVEDFDFIHSAG
jgi:hypothetical protein